MNIEIYLDDVLKGRGFSGCAVHEASDQHTDLALGSTNTWGKQQYNVASVDDERLGVKVYGTGDFYTKLSKVSDPEETRVILAEALVGYMSRGDSKMLYTLFSTMQKNSYEAGKRDGVYITQHNIRQALGL